MFPLDPCFSCVLFINTWHLSRRLHAALSQRADINGIKAQLNETGCGNKTPIFHAVRIAGLPRKNERNEF